MEASIKKYEVEIKGNTPIIYNRMKKEIEDARKKVRKNELAEYEEKNWIEKAEIIDGHAIMPSEWVKSNLINSSKKCRLIPHFETKKNATYTQYVQGMMVQNNPPIRMAKKSELKQMGGYYPSQPGKFNCGKVWKIFPKLDEWKVKFTIIDPFGRMKIDELKELLTYGGWFIGLGDQRPMGFGRFEVVSVKELNN